MECWSADNFGLRILDLGFKPWIIEIDLKVLN